MAMPENQQRYQQAAGVAGDPLIQQANAEQRAQQNPGAQMRQAMQMIAMQIQQLQAQIAQIEAEIAQNQGRDLNLLNARSKRWVEEIMRRNEEERLRGR